MKLVTVREGISSGIHPSTKELEVPLWVAGKNVLFRTDRVEKIPGWIELGANLFPNAHAVYSHRASTGVLSLFIQHGSTLSLWNGVGFSSLLTGLTQRDNDTILLPAIAGNFVTWGDEVLFTNNAEAPYRLAPAATLLGVAELTTCRILRKLGPHVIAFATQDGPDVIQWCSANNILDWDFLSTVNTAGKRTLREVSGGIRCVEQLGNRLAIYTKDTLHIMTYIGGGFIFATQLGLDGIGSVGPRAVVSLGRKNYGYSPNGFFVTDGSQFTYIDSPEIREYVRGRVNPAQLSKVCGYHDDQSNQIRWFYPAGASLECNEGVGYDYLRDAWTLFNFGMSAVESRSVFDWAVGMPTSGKLSALNQGVDGGVGIALPASVRTKRLDLGDASVWKFIDQLKMECAADVTFRAYETLTGPVVQTITQTLTGDFTPMEIQASARFFSIEIETTAVGGAWSLGSFDILGSFAGADA